MVYSVILVGSFLLFILQPHLSASALINENCAKKNYFSCQFYADTMELWCDDSNLTEIPHPETVEGRFAPVIYTRTIFMNHSCIKTIDTATLRRYGHLRELDLSDNLIVSLSEASFSWCEKLETLRVAGNNLTSIRTNTFAGLKELVELDLGRNQIASLDIGALDDVTKLQVLILKNNQIAHLQEKLFQKLIFLKTLDLSGNELKILTAWQLQGLAQLTFLNLRNNRLTSIDKLIFISIPIIKNVDLRNNSLACIDHNIFYRTDVSAVKLNNNKLRIPQPDWFRKLRRKEMREQLSDIDSLTSNNPWHCGCKSIAYLRMKDLRLTHVAYDGFEGFHLRMLCRRNSYFRALFSATAFSRFSVFYLKFSDDCFVSLKIAKLARFVKYEIGDLDWWLRKLNVQCASPSAFQGRMLSTLSEKIINDHFNGSCSLLTSEKHFCEIGTLKNVVSTEHVVEEVLTTVEKSVVAPISTRPTVATGLSPHLKSSSTEENESDKSSFKDNMKYLDEYSQVLKVLVILLGALAFCGTTALLLWIKRHFFPSKDGSLQSFTTTSYSQGRLPSHASSNHPNLSFNQRHDYTQSVQEPLCENPTGVHHQQYGIRLLENYS